jgi:subtilase family serine protease
MIRHHGKQSRKPRNSPIEALEPRQLLSVAPIVGPPFDPAADGYTPAEIRHAYGFDQIPSGAGGIPIDGRGQTIAIIDAGDNPTMASDLSIFDAQFGLPDPPSFKVVDQTGGTNLPPPDMEGAGETTLDVEWAHAVAPMANILLVEANNLDDADLNAAIDYARHAPAVSVISMSFGGSEFFTFVPGGQGDQLEQDPLYTTPAGHQGVTFVASAGDSSTLAGVSFPAASPNVLSIGGTNLQIKDPTGTYGVPKCARRDIQCRPKERCRGL